MATSTLSFINNIDWPTAVTVILGSGLLAAVFSGGVSWYLSNRSREDARYEKLYGPLRFHLLMMKLLVENRDSVLKDIEDWLNVEMRINLMQKHMSPLTQKWIKHRDDIRSLFEQNPGLVKKEDFNLMSDFMDGCVKREIIEEGQNVLAVNEDRTNKLLKAVEDMQNRLL